jgi:hypothetical protein
MRECSDIYFSFELLRTANVSPWREMLVVMCYSEYRKKANDRYLKFSRASQKFSQVHTRLLNVHGIPLCSARYGLPYGAYHFSFDISFLKDSFFHVLISYKQVIVSLSLANAVQEQRSSWENLRYWSSHMSDKGMSLSNCLWRTSDLIKY